MILRSDLQGVLCRGVRVREFHTFPGHARPVSAIAPGPETRLAAARTHAVATAPRRVVLVRDNPLDAPLDSEVPQPPLCTRYFVNDASIEKLHLLLRDNPAGLLYVRDELAGWIAQLDKRTRDRASPRARRMNRRQQ